MRLRGLLQELHKFLYCQSAVRDAVLHVNAKLCERAKRETQSTLNAVVADASRNMKNGYNRGDH